ncbi:MAG: hypothetical protein NTZ64_18095 [Polaromonas sp.]|nr:hypothetical protein [Polaromonas sp.]
MAEVAIRFTADGRAVVTAAREAEAALQGINAQAGRTNSTLQATRDASAGVNTSFASIGKASLVFGAVNAAASGLLGVMQRLPASGIQFAAQLETTQVGMAGILASMTSLEGKATSYAQGLELASGITQRLQQEAMRTSATTQELVGAFTALLGPGLAAGMKVKEIEKLTSTGVNAVKSMGLASNQVVQELRDLVQGGITASSSTLATALGLKDADIAKAKASAQGLYAFLMERMKGFEEAGPVYAKTFTGVMDQLAEQVKMTSSVIFAPLADALKEQADGIRKALNSSQNVTGLSTMTGAITALATGLGTATRFAIEHSGAILTMVQAYGAIKFGAMVAGWAASAQAMAGTSAASRLLAAQTAVEALTNTQLTMTSQQKLAAYIAELAAKQASAQATVAETAGRVVFLQTSVAMLEVSRAEVVAKMAATRTTVAQAEAQLAAARAAGAQSFAIALVTEATATLAAAQLTQAALSTQLAVLGGQQAMVHTATAAAIGAQAAATEGAALATGQLAAAQRAASASTSAMGSVIGALGGPVGIAIAAVGLLILKLASLRSEGQTAALDAQSLERVKTANASGKKAESRDTNKIPAQVEALKSQADQLELDIKNNDPWAINGKIEKDRLAHYHSELDKVRQRTAELSGIAAAAEAISQKSEAGLQLNAMGSTKALDALLGKQKTASAAIAEAKLEGEALDNQLKAVKDNKTTTPAQAVEYENRVAEAKKAIAVKLQSELKSISKKGQEGVAAAYNDGVNAQIEALKKSQALQVQISGQTVNKLASEHKRGLLTEVEYINQVADAEKKVLTSSVATAEAELALAATKTKNKKELATLEGSVAQAREKLVSRELEQGYALLELEYKIDTERRQLYSTAINSSISELDSMTEKNKATRLEIEAIGLTGEALAKLTQARMDDAIWAQRQKIAAMRVFDDAGSSTDAIQLEIDKLAQLQEARTLEGTKITRQSASAEWGKFYEDVQQGLTDSLYRAFESGKGFFETFWSGIKNLFKTTVLKLAVQAVVGSVTGALGSAANASTTGASANGGSGMPSLGSLSNLFGGANPLADFGMSATNAFYNLGGMATNAGFTNLGNVITTNATAMGNFASVAGDALGYLNSIQAIANGQYGAGIGGAIGTYFGGPIGSFIGSKIGGFVDNYFAGEMRSGATYDTGADGKARYQQGPSGGEITGDSARAMFDSAQASINATLKALGSKATLTGYTAGLESSKNGKGFDFAGGYIDGKAFGENLGRDGGQFAMKSQDGQEAFTAYGVQLSQSIIEALQVSDIPKSITDIINTGLNGAAASSLSSEAVTKLLATINTVVVAVNSFNDAVLKLPFENLKNLSFDAAAGLIAAAGGMDALSSGLTGYYNNFYTEEEKRLQTIKNINAATAGSGLDAATATRAEYRALVEAQDLTTESGRAMYLSLLGVQDAFASLTPIAADLTTQLGTLTDAIGKMFDELNSQISSQRASVVSGRETITGGVPVRTYAQIMSSIAQTGAAAPGQAALNAAQAKYDAAVHLVNSNKTAITAADTRLTAATSTATSAKNNASKYQSAVDAQAVDVVSAYLRFGNINQRMDVAAPASLAGLAVWNDSSASMESKLSSKSIADIRAFAETLASASTGGLRGELGSTATFKSEIQQYLDSKTSQASATPALDAKINSTAAAVSAAQQAVIAANSSLATSTTAAAAADKALATAKEGYAASVTAWVSASALSADALGKLKDETLAYYAQQKALAEAMHTSATGLRTAVAAAQLQTLSSAQSLSTRLAAFASDYSLAKSTSGDVKAGYADKMAAALPQLSQDLSSISATRADWALAVAKLGTKSRLIADQLDASAPAAYEAQSLVLLGAIDGKLAGMNSTAATLQASITTAVNNGAATTAAGLSNLIKAVQGDKSASLQKFATGGVFTNSVVSSPTNFALGQMGEAGPEAIMPLASGPGGSLGVRVYGGSGANTAKFEALVVAQTRELNAMRYELRAIVTASNKTAKTLERVVSPDGSSLCTSVAV